VQAVLARWNDRRAGEPKATAAQQLNDASADELLEFIDNELGCHDGHEPSHWGMRGRPDMATEEKL